MMPAITRYFHDIAFILGWFAFMILISAGVSVVIARKYGRTKQTRQAIYSVAGLIGLAIAAAITIARLRGVRFTP
jgi:hypothetical protein